MGARSAKPRIRRIVAGLLLANSYLVCGEEGCAIVDPGGDAEALLKAAGPSAKVVAVVATHMHFDHVWAARDVAEATGAPFYVHRADWEMRDVLLSLAEDLGFKPPEPPRSASFLEEGDELLGLRVLHVPGHTPGSIALVGDGFVITGDLLFRGSVGRADLPGGDPELLRSSVCRIYSLHPDFTVYPGHGDPTTVGEEASSNAFVRADDCRAARQKG